MQDIEQLLKKAEEISKKKNTFKIEGVEMIKGEKGDKGDKGERGERGERGFTGLSGKDGKDGKNGKDGKDGRDGIDGKDGQDFTPDLNALTIDVINTIESFEGDEKLDVLKLKNLDKLLEQAQDFEIDATKIKGLKDLLPTNPPEFGGGSGATFIKSMRDVDLTGLTDGKILKWNSSERKWKPSADLDTQDLQEVINNGNTVLLPDDGSSAIIIRDADNTRNKVVIGDSGAGAGSIKLYDAGGTLGVTIDGTTITTVAGGFFGVLGDALAEVGKVGNYAGYFSDSASNTVTIGDGTYAINAFGLSVFSTLLINETSPYDGSVVFEVNGMGGFSDGIVGAYFNTSSNGLGYFYDSGGNTLKILNSGTVLVADVPSFWTATLGGSGGAGSFNDTNNNQVYLADGYLAVNATGTVQAVETTTDGAAGYLVYANGGGAYYGVVGKRNIWGQAAGLFDDTVGNSVILADGDYAINATGISKFSWGTGTSLTIGLDGGGTWNGVDMYDGTYGATFLSTINGYAGYFTGHGNTLTIADLNYAIHSVGEVFMSSSDTNTLVSIAQVLGSAGKAGVYANYNPTGTVGALAYEDSSNLKIGVYGTKGTGDIAGKFEDGVNTVNLSDGTNAITATGNAHIDGTITSNGLKAHGSGGLLFESNSGTDVALFGAGGGAGVTFYDGVALNTMTAGSVLFAGASGLISQDNANFFYDDATNQLELGAGSQTAPSYSFGGDPDTGVFSNGVNNLGFTTGGVLRWQITSSGNLNGGLYSLAATRILSAGVSGSASAPVFSFGGGLDEDTGMFRVSADVLGFATGGTERFRIFSTAIESSGQVRGAAGSAGSPYICGSNDTNTGLFSGGSDILGITVGGTERANYTTTTLTFADGYNIAFNTTTGTKIGTSTTQKIGFYNATPVVQGASIADATGGSTVDAEARTAVNAVISRLEALGLIATI